MALEILLIDPDFEWSKKNKAILEDQFFSVTHVENGKDAQRSIYANKYFFIVMSNMTEDYSAHQVMKFIHAQENPQRTVILDANLEMEEEERVKSYKEWFRLGVVKVIPKGDSIDPLLAFLEGYQTLNDLLKALKRKAGQSDEQEVEIMDETVTKIAIDDFYSSKSVLFDIFIKIKDNYYIKILHAGDAFSKDRINKYKEEKDVQFLYFLKKDRRKYIKLCEFISKKLVSNANVPAEKKVGLLRNVTEKYLEEAFFNGVGPAIVQQGKDICEQTYKMIQGQKDLHKLLKNYQDFDPTAYTHGFLVALYASAIVKQFDWQTKGNIETIALASLLHDVGKSKISPAIATKREQDLTEEELEEYQNHPALSVEMLHGNRAISNSVKNIILQHHEYFNGSGFPNGIRGSNLLLMANIIGAVDDFADRLVHEGMSPPEALKSMITNNDGRFNTTIFDHFIRIFVDPDQVFKDIKKSG